MPNYHKLTKLHKLIQLISLDVCYTVPVITANGWDLFLQFLQYTWTLIPAPKESSEKHQLQDTANVSTVFALV